MMNKSLLVYAILISTAIFSVCHALDHPVITNEESVPSQPFNSAFEQRLLSFDRNQDGLIQRSELPATNHQQFDEWDYDRNGVLDEREHNVLIYFDQNGELPESEVRRRIEDESRNKGLALENGYYRSPEPSVTVGEFVGRALTFDSNGDGSLDEKELIKMAETFVKIERFNRARRFPASRIGTSGLSARTHVGGGGPAYLSNLNSPVRLPTVRRARSNGPRRAGGT